MRSKKMLACAAAVCVIAAVSCVFPKAPVLGEFSVSAEAAKSVYLEKVSGISARLYSDGSAFLHWETQNIADGYVIYVSESENGKYRKAAVIDNGTYDLAAVVGFSADKEYWFKVRAYRYSGGKRLYGDRSEPVKALPDLSEYLKDKAPLYSRFLKELRDYPLHIRYRYTPDGSYYETVETYIFSAGENYLIVSANTNDSAAYISTDGCYYTLYPESRTATVIHCTKQLSDRLKSLDIWGNYFNYDMDIPRDTAVFKTGTKTYNGKKYLYNEIIAVNDASDDAQNVVYTFYADRKTQEMKYIIIKGNDYEVKFEIDQSDHKSDRSVLEIPGDYAIADISVFC